MNDNPLIFRLAASVKPLPKTGIEDAHRSIVSRLRRYSGESVAAMAIANLWPPRASKDELLQSAPWHTLLLVKWALQDGNVNIRMGAPIPVAEFDRLRQELWDLPDSLLAGDRAPNVFLLIRSLMHVQIQFQRNASFGFLRWPALFARLAPDKRSRRQFREVIGMEPDDFMDLGAALYGAVTQRKMPLAASWFEPLRPTYGPSLDRMLALFARDLPSLRSELRHDVAQRVRGKRELYEFPYLQRFPLLRLRDGRLQCWHPVVFARGLEEAVHLRLSALGKDYVDSFSRVFEEYVTELARSSGAPMLDEAGYKALAGHNAAAVEAILDGDGCNILVEAKMSLFADDVLLTDSEKDVFNKTKRIREAVAQGWQVGAFVRNENNPFDQRFNQPHDFLLVVTNRELIVGGGEMLQRLFAPGMFGYPRHDDQARERLPLTNIFVLSIEDFEMLMQVVASKSIDLTTLLKQAALANQDGQTSELFFSGFLVKHLRQGMVPPLLQEACDASLSRVARALGAPALTLEAIRERETRNRTGS